MNDSPVKIHDLIKFSFLSLIVIIFVYFYSFFDTRTKIVFCDVGQGDAAYLRIHNKIDVLIDTGPNNKILDCLGKYMPFFDRTIELTILSHPDSDHIAGFLPIIEHYNLQTIILPPFEKNSNSYKTIKEKILTKKIKQIIGQKGLSFNINRDIITVLSPNINDNCSAANECSLITLFTEGRYKALFTGDATTKELLSLPAQSIKNLDILKIPHHGSKYGLTKSFFRLADPVVSVISVGKNNAYGHPAKEVLDLLKASKTKIRRTDTEGNIVFKLPN